jgi:hypothetical protein
VARIEMSPARLASIGLVAMGIVALAAGGDLLLLKVHHTIGIGSIVVGFGLEAIGVAMVFKSRSSGLEQRKKSPPRWVGGPRLQTVIAAAIIVGTTFGSYLYVSSQVSAQSGGQSGISLNVDSATEVTYPDGSIGVAVQVSAVGGVPPYTYTALWEDRSNQTSSSGNFTRVFAAGVPLSFALAITAKGANKGLGHLSLSLPLQISTVTGVVSTKSLSVITSASKSQAGNSPGRTQTSETNTVVAANGATSTISGGQTTRVSNASSSSSTVSASSSASSSSTSAASSSGGFEVTVIVRGESSGQAISGATVVLDGTSSQVTPTNGTTVFFGVSAGQHSIVVTYGAWSITIPYTATAGSLGRIFVNVPGD